ncbi:MAG: alkaline phosphatase family protein [Candidatus Magnetoovum sp. WYHC-5]|nr:alkaline phosphatase family protein [Candidatus Magnetoovum sp. WYHC-5]
MLSFLRKKTKSNKKAIVIGLDGVPYTLLMEYIKRGIMPAFASLLEKGQLIQMKSTVPEVSSVAWSSFMTGKNPGEHGIFGFMGINPESYEYTFPNFNALKIRPLWERQDIRTVALNIPQTYPARDINGVMVSGFVALDLKKAVTPASVYDYLKGIDYKLDVNAAAAKDNPQLFFTELFNTFEKRITAIKHLYHNEDWQLFIGTITETDRLHHYFYNNAYGGEYYEIFTDFYVKLDTFIGEMAEMAISNGTLFATMSDHGFTDIKSEVYINRWLIEEGYLSLDFVDGGLKGINERTKAFCLDPSRIYLHLKDRYKKGTIDSAETETLRNELKAKAYLINFNGSKVIERVFLKEEIFKGPYANEGPELYLLPKYGFDLKGQVNKKDVFGTSPLKGMHTYDDAHFYCTTPIDMGNEDFSIVEVIEVIRASMG